MFVFVDALLIFDVDVFTPLSRHLDNPTLDGGSLTYHLVRQDKAIRFFNFGSHDASWVKKIPANVNTFQLKRCGRSFIFPSHN